MILPGRVCRECGCTATTACYVNMAKLGSPVYTTCGWAEWDLCTGCLPGVESIPWDDAGRLILPRPEPFPRPPEVTL